MSAVLDLLFGYLYRAPLLYSPMDWGMLVGQFALMKWCIKTIKGEWINGRNRKI